MYKFKFEPPQEHRRSLQNHKSDHVALLNILDKCTQILREDRLWIRNQIKQHNQALLSIFKQHPKHSQLPSLQVKLRKHVQNVKTRIKQEQLTKFRETFNQESTPLDKRQLPPRPAQSCSRGSINGNSHLRSTPSLELNKTAKAKHNRSQELSPSCFRGNSSLSQNNLRELIRQKYNQEVIEERESENVTSARLRREDNDQGAPLQELKPNFNNTYVYSNFSDGKRGVEPLSSQVEMPSNFPWQFEKKAKQTLYEHQPELTLKQQAIPDISQGFSRIDKSVEDKDDSIFDRHFNDSEKVSVRYDSSEVNAEFKSLEYDSRGDIVKFQLREEGFKEPHFESTDENLFTPQELLNQCRNFLKHRENPAKEEPFKASKQLEIPRQEPQCIFNRNNRQDSDQKEKERDEESYVYPEIGVTEDVKKSSFVYPHFETFANSSGEKYHFEKANSPPQLTRLSEPKVKKTSLSPNFRIEELLEDLMDHIDMDLFITAEQLGGFLKNYGEGQVLEMILGKLYEKDKICVTEVGDEVQAAMRRMGRDYHHSDEAVNAVYNLLDISQKGEVSMEDVESFLEQFEEAEVPNFDEVSSELIRLFRGADFTNEQRLTYWHFFVVRESEEFREVSRLLGQFEFEIEQES